MKILLVGYRDPAHSSAGGYDAIAKYPGADYLNGTFIPWGKPRNLFWRVYRLACVELLYLIARIRRRKYDLMHCFYGDGIIFSFSKSKRHKIVITTHKDVKNRTRYPRRYIRTLQKADGVIVLSSAQAKQLREEFNINATFIPHGFYTPTFKDCKFETFDKNKVNVFVSGKMYRDYGLVIRMAKYCEINCPNIHFHGLGQHDKVKQELGNNTNFTVYPRLDDDKYFSLLSQCDYNFLPVTFASANNTLLEGQFLGIKGIFPNTSGIDDYAAPAPMNIFYENEDDLKNIFRNLQKNASPDKELIKYSDKFSWANVYKILEQYYSDLVRE